MLPGLQDGCGGRDGGYQMDPGGVRRGRGGRCFTPSSDGHAMEEAVIAGVEVEAVLHSPLLVARVPVAD
jgi:hypothetical protein